ncbi:MAG TPA: hypothetical protein VE615_04165 [Gaiellaceae bacterium]|nr:hypothetical protein [Gaiellaceae bacterium]
MLARLRRFLARLGGGSLQRGDHAHESKRPVENTDAIAASGPGPRDTDPTGNLGGYSFPPNYVPPADEGRPRH